MARLNIETEIFTDMRFLDLLILVGNRETAIGKLISFWIVAQKYWLNDRKLVPKEVFDRLNLGQLIDVGLAEIRDNGIYSKGSEERFGWLLLCKEAGKRGGNKSAELRSRVGQGSSRVSNLLTPTLSLKKEEESATGGQFHPSDLAELWNLKKSDNQPAVKLSSLKSGSPRYRSAAARIKDEPDQAYWENVISKISASPFCNGLNDRRWKANFDFLIKPETHHKAIEGNYDDRLAQNSRQKFLSLEDIK